MRPSDRDLAALLRTLATHMEDGVTSSESITQNARDVAKALEIQPTPSFDTSRKVVPDWDMEQAAKRGANAIVAHFPDKDKLSDGRAYFMAYKVLESLGYVAECNAGLDKSVA